MLGLLLTGAILVPVLGRPYPAGGGLMKSTGSLLSHLPSAEPPDRGEDEVSLAPPPWPQGYGFCSPTTLQLSPSSHSVILDSFPAAAPQGLRTAAGNWAGVLLILP